MKTLIKLAGAALALISASCAYDPYYSPNSVNTSYSVGYGQGFGWGGPAFSTSVFVGTGNPRWGYDPYCRSYFDYTRRSYYDPYLCGYYPIGFRPQAIVGVPHPHGWNTGRGFCPPPTRVTTVTLNNFQNRELAYRRSNFSWANQVRQQPIVTGRSLNQPGFQNPYTRPSPFGGFRSTQPSRNFSNPDPRQGSRGFSRSQINVPNSQPQANFRQVDSQRRQQISPSSVGIRPMAPPDRVGPPPQSYPTSGPSQTQGGGFRGQGGTPYSGGQGRGQRERY